VFVFIATTTVAVQMLSKPAGSMVGKPKPPAFKEEARMVLVNLAAVLEDSGSSTAKVLKTTCLLTTMDNYAAFNEVCAFSFCFTWPFRFSYFNRA